ncbi:hypothetical protein D8L93_01550 [Sodalis-like symbiont of Bactericera trigonica]|nr:hypothetical protein D8L93_01550 [Sodalis-like symbiont of Bactericera trigonica]
MNEGGFDSQRWAMANHPPLQGRVLRARPLDHWCNLRQRFVERAVNGMQQPRWRALMLALGFGITQEISGEEWQLLSRTGIAHLMAISGLHIGLAPLFGWLCAAGYVALSGANIPRPARPAGAEAVERGAPAGHDTQPVAEFAMVHRIYPCHCSIGGQGWCGVRWLHLQVGITLLLLPMQCPLFHGCNPLALAANVWAVPVVSFITTLLILVAIVTGGQNWLSAQLWRMADLSLSGVMVPLAPLQQGCLTLPGQGLAFIVLGWLGIIIWRFGWWLLYPLTLGLLATWATASR